MTELQKKELEILGQIAELFEKHGIHYYLAYGTALGAVRHQGFIPWDDDVDLFILPREYDKIRKMFREEDTGSLRLHDYTTVQGYPYVFPKIVDCSTELKEKAFSHLPYRCGVYVDLFLAVPVYDHPIRYFLDEKWMYLQYGIIQAYYRKPKNFLQRILHRIAHRLCSVEKAQERLYQRYFSKKVHGKYIKEPNVYSKKQLVKRTYFLKETRIMFENLWLPIFEEYESYLKDTYGNYKLLPPKEEQIPAHDFSYLILK